MKKIFNKTGIGVAILILIILGLFFAFRRVVPKEISLPYHGGVASGVIPQASKAVLEIENTKYEAEITEGETVYDFMDKFRQEGKISLVTKNYTGIGVFIEEINGIKRNGKQSWIYYVNDKLATIGVSNYKLKSGDVVLWKYENNIY